MESLMARSPFYVVMIAGAALLTGTSAVRMVSAQSADERAVRAVAQAYFDGRARRDTVLLGSAFLLPQATMYAWRDTALLELPILRWLERIANAPSTPRDPNDRDRIVSVDIDHTVAHLKLQTTTAQMVITDHMNLVKVNGRWVVVSKIFEAVPR
jgi:putative lumazine-binding protein